MKKNNVTIHWHFGCQYKRMWDHIQNDIIEKFRQLLNEMRSEIENKTKCSDKVRSMIRLCECVLPSLTDEMHATLSEELNQCKDDIEHMLQQNNQKQIKLDQPPSRHVD